MPVIASCRFLELFHIAGASFVALQPVQFFEKTTTKAIPQAERLKLKTQPTKTLSHRTQKSFFCHYPTKKEG
jgi:hypothetical protein